MESTRVPRSAEICPLIKLRATANKANFYPLIDFVHFCHVDIHHTGFYPSFESQAF